MTNLTGLTADSGRLNQALKDAERMLRDMNVGVEVNVTMGSKQRLYFSRDPHTREWGLYVRDEKIPTMSAAVAPKYTSIHEAGRETRAEAAKYLKALWEQLILAAEKMQVTVAEAADEAEDFLALIKARQAGLSIRSKRGP